MEGIGAISKDLPVLPQLSFAIPPFPALHYTITLYALAQRFLPNYVLLPSYNYVELLATARRNAN